LPEWFALSMVFGQLRIDADVAAQAGGRQGFALMPLSQSRRRYWQPKAVENLAHGPADRQITSSRNCSPISEREGSRRVVDWEQIDPLIGTTSRSLLQKMAERSDAAANLALCAAWPGFGLHRFR